MVIESASTEAREPRKAKQPPKTLSDQRVLISAQDLIGLWLSESCSTCKAAGEHPDTGLVSVCRNGLFLKATLTCKSCGSKWNRSNLHEEKVKVETSDRKILEEEQENIRFISAVVTTPGASFHTVERVCNAIGLSIVSKQRFFNGQKAVSLAMTDVAQVSYEKQMNKLKQHIKANKECWLCISIDGRWGQRRESGFHSLTARTIDPKHPEMDRLVIFQATLQKDQRVRGKTISGNYAGSSKGMEAAAFKRALDTMSRKGVLKAVRTIVLDRDSSCRSILKKRKDTQHIEVKSDPGHMAKNYFNRVQRILGQSAKFKGFAQRMKLFFMRCVTRAVEEGAGDSAKMVELFRHYWMPHGLQHYLRKQCPHDCPCQQTVALGVTCNAGQKNTMDQKDLNTLSSVSAQSKRGPKGKEKQNRKSKYEILEELHEKMSENAPDFVSPFHTCHVENANSVIARAAPKQTRFAVMYEAISHFVMAEINEGAEAAVAQVCERVKAPLLKSARAFLAAKDRRTYLQRLNKISEKSKQRRAELKYAKKETTAAELKATPKDHKYHGTQPISFTNKKAAKPSQKKRKAPPQPSADDDEEDMWISSETEEPDSAMDGMEIDEEENGDDEIGEMDQWEGVKEGKFRTTASDRAERYGKRKK